MRVLERVARQARLVNDLVDELRVSLLFKVVASGLNEERKSLSKLFDMVERRGLERLL